VVVYLKGSYSSSSCSRGVGIFACGGGGGGAALGISDDCRALGGGCDGNGGGAPRGAETEGMEGGAVGAEPTEEWPEVTSSKLDSFAWAFRASLCSAVGAISVS
jgi:hypothetical protein